MYFAFSCSVVTSSGCASSSRRAEAVVPPGEVTDHLSVRTRGVEDNRVLAAGRETPDLDMGQAVVYPDERDVERDRERAFERGEVYAQYRGPVAVVFKSIDACCRRAQGAAQQAKQQAQTALHFCLLARGCAES